MTLKKIVSAGIFGFWVMLVSSSCSTTNPRPAAPAPHQAFRNTASQDPNATLLIKTTDGNTVEVPRSEINRINAQSCPPCDAGYTCNPHNNRCEMQD